MPSYDLCPAVTVDEIIQQMRTATRELAQLGRPLVISGHSAGGHLAACLLATDWRALDASLPADLIHRGLRHFRPVRSGAAGGDSASTMPCVSTQRRAKAASPLFWHAPARGSLDAVVGENESAEYFRQSRTMVERWGRPALRPGSA